MVIYNYNKLMENFYLKFKVTSTDTEIVATMTTSDDIIIKQF